MCRVEWSPLLELYELTAEVKDENGRTLMRGLSAKVSCRLCLHTASHWYLVTAVECACQLVLVWTADVPSQWC